MAEDPVCIHRTNTIEEAEILVAWLDDHGVEARIMDRDNPGVFAFGVTDTEGVEIYVADQETAERAKALLAKHDQEHEAAAPQGTTAAPLEVKCDECGQLNSFPPGQAGTVQECSHCGAFLDLPSA